MSPQSEAKSSPKTGVIIAVILILVALYGGFRYFTSSTPEPIDAAKEQAATTAESGSVAVETPTVVDVGRVESDAKLKEMMDQRKEDYGTTSAVAAIVKSDETIQVGDTQISMNEILDKIRLQRGDVIESDIGGPGTPELEEYGIYLVHPGDNIWNIHFRFLKDYLSHKGIAVGPMADEPVSAGGSSGVGKLLKFSEKIVYIYNVKERRLDVDLDMIQPMTKIVVYNMKEVFALLDQIDYDHVNHIQFDGETIWIPAEQ
jgi:hypothetical protein